MKFTLFFLFICSTLFSAHNPEEIKQRPRLLYLDLMKKSLTDILYEPAQIKQRETGSDWPSRAYTMIGLKRLDNVQYCVESVLKRNIPGDLIETGVWRGGTTIFMRAILQVYGNTTKKVWVADSFEGLPPPNAEKYPEDQGLNLHLYNELSISLEQVQSHFKNYNLLDDQVVFLKGWFKDTLPNAPIKQISVLRLDGDLYESTMDALIHLYPKLSVGGYVIVDDYGAIPACKAAVHDFRNRFGIADEIIGVDWTGVYWQKS